MLQSYALSTGHRHQNSIGAATLGLRECKLSPGCIKINYMYMVEEGNTYDPETVAWR